MKNSQVIFDWSGTISNDFLIVLGAVNCVLTQFGKPTISPAGLRRSFSTDLKSWYAARGIDDFDEVQRLYTEISGTNGKPKIIPGALEAVNRILELSPVSIFSSHPYVHLEQEARSYGLPTGKITLHGDVSKDIETPNQGFEKLLKEIPRERVLYFGDTIVDINLANHYRLISVAVADENYSYHDRRTLRKANPKYLINSISEASDLVRKILT